MTSYEKCEYLKNKGYTYNPETGEVFSHKGNLLTNKNTNGYKRIKFRMNEKYYEVMTHQFAFYMTFGYIPNTIDHINRVRSDNRIVNLREITNQQNQFNRNAKGYLYVPNKAYNNWKALIAINNKQLFLGYFNTEEEARNAYLQAKEIYHKIG